MEIEIIFKIAGIGILTSIITHVLKHSGKDDIATLASLSGIIIVLMMVINLISDLFDTVKNLFSLY